MEGGFLTWLWEWFGVFTILFVAVFGGYFVFASARYFFVETFIYRSRLLQRVVGLRWVRRAQRYYMSGIDKNRYLTLCECFKQTMPYCLSPLGFLGESSNLSRTVLRGVVGFRRDTFLNARCPRHLRIHFAKDMYSTWWKLDSNGRECRWGALRYLEDRLDRWEHTYEED